MALSATARGNGNHNTGSASLSVTPGSNFAAGSMAVLWVAYDNSGSSGADPYSSITDSVGNTWFPHINSLRDPGAANAGVVLRGFYSFMEVATLTTSNTITVSFSPNVTAKAWTLTQVTPDAGSRCIVKGGAQASTATASPSQTTASITSGDMVHAAVGAESGTTQTFTGDSDTTNGSWSTQQTDKIGSTTSGIGITSQSKVVSATATQTYNPTLGISSDLCIAHMIIGQQTTTAQYRDSYSGSGSDTWPNANTGGAYTLTGTAADFDEAGGFGTVTLGATGATRVAGLGSVAQQDQSVLIKFKVDKLPTSGGSPAVYVSAVGRYVDASNYYFVKFYVESSGTIRLELNRRVAAAEATIGSLVTPGDTYVAGDVYNVRLQLVGLNPTQLAARFWKQGNSEPSTWLCSGTDSSAALQVSDGVGVRVVWDNITNDPIVVSFDDLIDGFAPSSPQTATPSTASLALSTFAPTVTVTNNKRVTPTTLALATTKFAPVLKLSVIPPVKALATAVFAPTIRLNKIATPPVQTLVTSSFAPSVLAPRLVTPGKLSLVTSAFAPVVSAPRLVTPPVKALVTATFAPTVSVTDHKRVTPGVAALSLSSFAPQARAPRLVTPTFAALTLTRFAPTVAVPVRPTPGVAALATSAFVPTVLTPRVVTPTSGALGTSMFAPTVATPRRVTPPTASLILSPLPPGVGQPTAVQPTTKALSLSAFAPTVSATAHQRVTPATKALSLSAFAPGVVATDTKIVIPGTAVLSTTIFPPDVQTSSGDRTAIPGSASLSLLGFAPSLSVTDNIVVTPETLALLLTTFPPRLSVPLSQLEVIAIAVETGMLDAAVAADAIGVTVVAVAPVTLTVDVGSVGVVITEDPVTVEVTE